MPPRTPYSTGDIATAVQDVLAKHHTIPTAAEAYGIPQRTLRTHVANARSGATNTSVTMGPSTIMPSSYEADLATWVLAMQQDGHPVGRREILRQANQMIAVVHDLDKPHKLSAGWYQRFLSRHPVLKTTMSQPLSKARNNVDIDTVVNFYYELVHCLSMVDFDPARVYNMDETSFSPSKMSKKVVVHRGSGKVYVEEASTTAHVTIVACVCADGSKVPPLFVLPGDRVTTQVCDNLTIPGAAVTTSEKGWSNSFICRKWLSMLSASILATTARPIVLVLDGCSSHYSSYIYDAALSHGFLLQFLPANSTHMFQPLDVTVFRPFKQAIRREIADNMWGDIATSVAKHQAIAIACRVWANPEASTISNGFVCTGLCPPSLDKMLYRLSVFKPTTEHVVAVEEAWLQRRTHVRSSVLLLPPQKKVRAQRKTLTVSGKFITAEYHALLQAQMASRATPRKKTTRRAVTTTGVDEDILEVCVL